MDASAADADGAGGARWFAVRCIFRFGSEGTDAATFEERITTWLAGSVEEAVELAEQEALTYADPSDEGIGATYIGLAQAFHMSGPPGHGAEVFSLMRRSGLDDDDYLDKHFDTGTERHRSVEEGSEPPS